MKFSLFKIHHRFIPVNGVEDIHSLTLKPNKMKKLILAAAVILSACTVNAFTVKTSATVTVGTDMDWMKAKDGTWMGKDKTWYKLDDKAMVWWSKDGKKWEASKDGMWQDKDGKWLKIDNKMLKWSADGGKTWSDVPEWKWQGDNGVWYKFDKDWSLWSMQASSKK
jgi:hypothetical protein